MTDVFNLMEFAEEESTGGGGGGYFCQITVDPGYLVYASGVSPTDRFFNAREMGKEAALEAAREMAQKYGCNKEAVMRLALYKDSVIGRDVTWKYDIWAHDFVVWQDAWKIVFKPSLEAAIAQGLEPGKLHWAQVSFKEDPRTPTRSDGTPNLRAYIVQLFNSREEALEAAGGEDAESSNIPPEPEKFKNFSDKPGAWASTWNDMLVYFGRDPNANHEIWVREDWGLTEKLVKKARQQALEAKLAF